MQASEIKRVIKESLPNAKINIADGTYASPATRWLTGNFYTNLYLPWTKKNGLSKWRDQFDCDNFAYLYFVFAQICHAKSGRKEEGLAVGVMYYMTDDGGGHAINFVVSKGEFKAIEPQSGDIVKLSEDERNSCWFVTC